MIEDNAADVQIHVAVQCNVAGLSCAVSEELQKFTTEDILRIDVTLCG
jgi:hypothetical protein